MGLIDKIEDLRQKPERTRKKVLFLTVGLCMILVLTFWVSNLSFGKNKIAKNAGDSQPSPWAVLRKTFQSGISDFKAKFQTGEVYQKNE
ncbi:hypothetical protein HYW53_03375 [Candidatus Giovannonibacteria bacterium]|nr:hypothetical protein [Candidatus Giovannonibacteria bacterium]